VTIDTLPHLLDRIRSRYPAALVCTTCLVLLATRPESYARSGLTEAQRLGYVCAECRADQAAAATLHAQRAAVGRANLERARAGLQARPLGAGPARLDERSQGRIGRPRRHARNLAGLPSGQTVTPGRRPGT
jgi:hypothetical protein